MIKLRWLRGDRSVTQMAERCVQEARADQEAQRAQALRDVAHYDAGRLEFLTQENKRLKAVILAIVQQQGGELYLHQGFVDAVGPADRLIESYNASTQSYHLRVVKR